MGHYYGEMYGNFDNERKLEEKSTRKNALELACEILQKNKWQRPIQNVVGTELTLYKPLCQKSTLDITKSHFHTLYLNTNNDVPFGDPIAANSFLFLDRIVREKSKNFTEDVDIKVPIYDLSINWYPSICGTMGSNNIFVKLSPIRNIPLDLYAHWVDIRVFQQNE